MPLNAVLIWSYFYPEESLLFGKRWMYKEDPELSEGAIRYTKVTSLISLIVIALIFLISIVIYVIEKLM
ncbi:hypothetical protein MPH47_19930 [Psychrobacillus psychrodurans]|uniref:hypothetical protein n=1 Tax=Psychrobacillus psychrodurans TaxID=126157 RepID=UPI000B8801A9|nr:hypothetical protein [Psychrobacillus psychrodurans]MCK1999467.1 hypothetical protein [Psychrobacillus psychrodurans]MCZ8540773.1 hypothetical protein [Psychrobacillus psychrodurans]